MSKHKPKKLKICMDCGAPNKASLSNCDQCAWLRPLHDQIKAAISKAEGK